MDVVSRQGRPAGGTSIAVGGVLIINRKPCLGSHKSASSSYQPGTALRGEEMEGNLDERCSRCVRFAPLSRHHGSRPLRTIRIGGQVQWIPPVPLTHIQSTNGSCSPQTSMSPKGRSWITPLFERQRARTSPSMSRQIASRGGRP